MFVSLTMKQLSTVLLPSPWAAAMFLEPSLYYGLKNPLFLPRSGPQKHVAELQKDRESPLTKVTEES